MRRNSQLCTLQFRFEYYWEPLSFCWKACRKNCFVGLREKVQRMWNSIDRETFWKLYNSFPQQLNADIDSNGPFLNSENDVSMTMLSFVLSFWIFCFLITVCRTQHFGTIVYLGSVESTNFMQSFNNLFGGSIIMFSLNYYSRFFTKRLRNYHAKYEELQLSIFDESWNFI